MHLAQKRPRCPKVFLYSKTSTGLTQHQGDVRTELLHISGEMNAIKLVKHSSVSLTQTECYLVVGGGQKVLPAATLPGALLRVETGRASH